MLGRFGQKVHVIVFVVPIGEHLYIDLISLRIGPQGYHVSAIAIGVEAKHHIVVSKAFIPIPNRRPQVGHVGLGDETNV